MKTNFTLRTGLLLAFVLALTNTAAQSIGDFRTTAAITANGMANATGWQTYNGSTWVTAIYSPVGNYGSQAVKSTGSAASGSNTVTLTAANSLIRVNQYVTNANVPAGTVVSAISGTTLTLSQNTTAAISSASLFFGEEFSVSNCSITNGNSTVTLAANPAIVVGMGVTGTGIPVGAIVNAISGTTTLTLTLSANSTATSTTTPLKFFTKETTATTTTNNTTITLQAPNSLVAVGMDVYSVTNGLIQNSATVTAINGAEITISIPVAVAYAGLPVQFAFFGTIPNLYINHNTSTVNNSKSFHIGNVFVNDANSANVGASGASPTDATLGIGGTTTSSTIFMCETLTVAPNAKVNIATTTSTLINNFFITNGVGGNAINNNGTIDLFTSPGATTTKTNIFFSGAGATTLAGTGTLTFNTFSLNRNTLNLTLAANTSINGGTIVTGASLIVNEGKVLTNTGSFTNAAGNLILKSSATGTASLLSTSSIPNVTQQRYLSSNQRGWRLLSNPIATKTFNALATASGITLGTGFTGAYEPVTNTWTSTDDTAAMDTQKAYKVFITGLSGESPTYTTGPSNVTLVNKGTAANTAPTLITTVTNQYYLVGNPYTAPVSVASILAASTGLSNTVSYYDPTVASTDVKVKAGGYNSTTVSGATGSATDVVIPPMGAIFVQATTNGSITIPKTAIFTGTPAQTGTYNHKTAQTKIASTIALKVEVSSGDVYYDAIALQFKAIGDAGSNIDFGKLPNTVLDAYSIAGSQKMAVSELELAAQTIPLGVTSTLQKNYTFKVVENTIPVGFEAVLIDNVLNTSTVLTAGTNYNFSIDSNPASQGDARFAINLKTAGSLSVVANELDSKIQLWPNPAKGQFNITNGLNQKDGTATIEISNINGQVIHSQKSNPGTTTTIQTNGWAAGVYILKATNNETQTTKKLIIQ